MPVANKQDLRESTLLAVGVRRCADIHRPSAITVVPAPIQALYPQARRDELVGGAELSPAMEIAHQAREAAGGAAREAADAAAAIAEWRGSAELPAPQPHDGPRGSGREARRGKLFGRPVWSLDWV